MKFQKHVPITKIDEEKRMVYGFASTPDLDSDGEIISLDALKNALPEYMEFPTLREMHQAKAIGTTKHAEILDDSKKGKGLFIGGKIVADDAWKLVKEGVLKAFSIGGNVIEKVDNVIKSLELVEISLVDVPANKSSVIELWKKESDTKKDPETLKLADALVKLNKDSNTVIMLTELLLHIKNVRFSYKIREKKTAPFDKMIEHIKKLIVVEAEEAEPKEVKRVAGNKEKINNALIKIRISQNGGEQSL